MILDNARPHHAKMLKDWLHSNRHRIELMFLPPYCPDLNPIEGIWQDAKSQTTYNEFYEVFDHFQAALTSKLRELGSNAQKLASRCNLKKFMMNSLPCNSTDS